MNAVYFRMAQRFALLKGFPRGKINRQTALAECVKILETQCESVQQARELTQKFNPPRWSNAAALAEYIANALRPAGTSFLDRQADDERIWYRDREDSRKEFSALAPDQQARQIAALEAELKRRYSENSDAWLDDVPIGANPKLKTFLNPAGGETLEYRLCELLVSRLQYASQQKKLRPWSNDLLHP